MAGMCCGIKVGETEPTSPVQPATRTARRRRMEIRKMISNISDISETHGLMKRRKSNSEFAVESSEPTRSLTLSVAVEKENSAPGDSGVDEEFPKFGVTSVCGRRRDMEDAVSIQPFFCEKEGSRKRKFNHGVHFYGVFDGHGCSHVAKKCKERMHAILKEEIVKRNGEAETEGESEDNWSETMSLSFNRMDKEVGERVNTSTADVAAVTTSCRCELQTPQCDAVGSTAVVAVVTREKIVVSNCGDSRAILCRGGVAVPLSSDHKPDRPDELDRIEKAGGRVIYWDGARVLGMLAMSRAIGDNYLKPYVIPDPEITITDRTLEDECLIIASDGLWDVVSNETAASVARMCLINAGSPPSPPQSPGNDTIVDAGRECSDKACSDASILLTKLALARHSADNVSVVVVDLRSIR
ncbi:protein phosphatase 2C 37-like [Silene latifolia]|uniref:protein phosphatase 2C 37-like n=1 Tax=Silene latifolia TaxID=37657 RepID=UPI003D77900B